MYDTYEGILRYKRENYLMVSTTQQGGGLIRLVISVFAIESHCYIDFIQSSEEDGPNSLSKNLLNPGETVMLVPKGN